MGDIFGRQLQTCLRARSRTAGQRVWMRMNRPTPIAGPRSVASNITSNGFAVMTLPRNKQTPLDGKSPVASSLPTGLCRSLWPPPSRPQTPIQDTINLGIMHPKIAALPYGSNVFPEIGGAAAISAGDNQESFLLHRVKKSCAGKFSRHSGRAFESHSANERIRPHYCGRTATVHDLLAGTYFSSNSGSCPTSWLLVSWASCSMRSNGTCSALMRER